LNILSSDAIKNRGKIPFHKHFEMAAKRGKFNISEVIQRNLMKFGIVGVRARKQTFWNVYVVVMETH
jgi:hypothetical protein